MPPKAKEAAPVPEIKPSDTNPWGVFVTVAVPSASLLLDVPPPKPVEEVKTKTPVKSKGAPAAPPTPPPPPPPIIPKIHFTLTYSDAFAPIAGKPSEPDPGQEDVAGSKEQQLTFSFEPLSFRYDTGLEALERLINTPVLLKLHDTITNNVLASMQLDLLPFAKGQQSFELPASGLVATEVAGEGVLKLLSGSVPKVEVALTIREAPADASPAAAAAEGAAEGGTEAPPLPEPQPYRYISEADIADGANVIELLIGPLEPVPGGLQTAIDLALGKDGQQGKVSFSAGVALPSPGPKLLLTGKMAPGKGVSFGDAPRRFLLSADAAETLRGHFEAGRGLSLEVARYVSVVNDTLADNAWDAWHAWTPLPGTQALLAEGAKQLPTSAPDGGPAAALEAWDAAAAGDSCLPPKPEPNPGAKPGKPLEPDLAPGSSAWQQAGTTIGPLLFRLVYPLVPVWSAPPPPSRTIPDVVPTRDLNPPPPPPTAADDVTAAVGAALRSLAAAHRDAPPEDAAAAAASPTPLPIAQRHKRLIFQLNHSGAYETLLTSLKGPLTRLVKEELAASGRMQPSEMGPLYSRLYARLLDLVHVQLAREAASASAAASAAAGRGPAGEVEAAKRQAPSGEESERLLVLAREYEEAGRWLLRCGGAAATSAAHALQERGQAYLVRAEALHQLRLLDRDTAPTWQAHAEFCLRCGQHDKALQSVRAALEVDPAYIPALLLIAGLKFEAFLARTTPGAADAGASRAPTPSARGAGSEAGTGEAAASPDELLDEALVAGHALLAVTEEAGKGVPWALLALLYQYLPGSAGASRRNAPWASCRQLLSQREREGLDSVPALLPQDANAFFQLRQRMLGLGLPQAAAAAHASVPLLQRSAAALGDEAQIAGIQATLLAPPAAEPEAAAAQEAALAAAAATARRLARGTGAASSEALLLQAEIAWRRGRLDDVVTYCQRAQAACGPSGCPLEVHLRLAETLMLLGQPQCAADAAIAAAAPPDETADEGGAAAAVARRASPLLWLVAGRACLGAGDAEGADAALTESNLLDPELPEPWGLLALLAARDRRWTDVLHALGRGRTVGLADAEALAAVAAEYESAGMWEEAAGVLQWAVQAAGAQGSAALELQRRLARVHATLGNARDARAVIDSAAEAAAAQAQAHATAAADAAAAAAAAAEAAAAAAATTSSDDAGVGQGATEDGAPAPEVDARVSALAVTAAAASEAAAAAQADAAAAGENVRHALLDELHLWRDALPIDPPMAAETLAAALQAEAEEAAAAAAAGAGEPGAAHEGWGPDAPADEFAAAVLPHIATHS